MPPVEFEPTISAGERPQTYALDRAATGTGSLIIIIIIIIIIIYCNWVVTRWQWLCYMYTKYEVGYY